MKPSKNPFLLFLPFLILDICIVFKFRNFILSADGPRYIYFAQNLTHGFYSPPPPAINLWNGPGYPIILAPFILLNIPFIFITLLNACFHYLSIVLLYKSLVKMVSAKKAVLFSFLWAFYIVAYEQIPYVATEPFTFFLITVIIFFLIRSLKEHNRSGTILAGICLGWLALVKVVFGYVLLALLLLYVLLFLINRSSVLYKKVIIITAIAFATTAPYLIYTYHLTGKLFYWGDSGGMSLYWMSSPFKNEFGDWQPADLSTLTKPPADSHPFKGTDNDDIKYKAFNNLINNHAADYQEILQKQGVERDELFKQKAVENIRKHPSKFLMNCFANFGRLIFNVPYSWKFQDPTMLVRIIINAVLFTFIIITLPITIYKWRKIDPLIRLMLFFVSIYFLTSLLVSAYSRMFYIIVPLILFWMAYVFERFIKISISTE